jgi:hypothetical protein
MDNITRIYESLKRYPNVIFTDLPVLEHLYVNEDNKLTSTCVDLKMATFDSSFGEQIQQLYEDGYSFYILNNSIGITNNPYDFKPIISLRCKTVQGLPVSPMKIKQKDNDRRKYLLLA